jgi:uncharacterized protein YeaO (DUF488 family)
LAVPFLEDSIYNPPQPGWRVLVMRRWPRGVRKDCIDEWYPDAAPSATLLKAYQDGELDFEEFSQRYTAEVRRNPGVLNHLRQLERVHGNVVLLCWERLPRPCDRMVLLDIFERRLCNHALRLSARPPPMGGLRGPARG